MGDERAQKKQQRAHARNRKICSTLHNYKSRRTVTITNRFIAAIERKLLQIEFAANVAGLTFFTCIRLTFKGEVATLMALLYTNSTMVLYTQIAKKLTPSIFHSHITFFSFFFFPNGRSLYIHFKADPFGKIVAVILHFDKRFRWRDRLHEFQLLPKNYRFWYLIVFSRYFKNDPNPVTVQFYRQSSHSPAWSVKL